jgi:hypothetical protein
MDYLWCIESQSIPLWAEDRAVTGNRQLRHRPVGPKGLFTGHALAHGFGAEAGDTTGLADEVALVGKALV